MNAAETLSSSKNDDDDDIKAPHPASTTTTTTTTTTNDDDDGGGGGLVRETAHLSRDKSDNNNSTVNDSPHLLLLAPVDTIASEEASDDNVNSNLIRNENLDKIAPIEIVQMSTDNSKDKRRAEEKRRRVSFPKNDAELITGYLEPVDPWACVTIFTIPELLELYRRSCFKHHTRPLEVVVQHIETLDLNTSKRAPLLNLKEQNLTHESCEALEEVFKRVQYRCMDFSSCGLDDTSLGIICDMVEYYEATNELDISDNHQITYKGWLTIINMVKKSQALNSLSTRGTSMYDTYAGSLGNALIGSAIHTLKLEHCGLSLRPIASLCSALKRNTVLKELWLAHNDLTCGDAYHIANLLKANYYIQFLDVSNNNIQDKGVEYIVNALLEQSVYFKNIQETKRKSDLNLMDLSKSLNNINNNKNYFPQKSSSAEVISLTPTSAENISTNKPASNGDGGGGGGGGVSIYENENKKTDYSLEKMSDDMNYNNNKKTIDETMKTTATAAAAATTVATAAAATNPEEYSAESVISDPPITEPADVIIETKDCLLDDVVTPINASSDDKNDQSNDDDNMEIADYDDDRNLQIVEENLLVDLSINEDDSSQRMNNNNEAPVPTVPILIKKDELQLLLENKTKQKDDDVKNENPTTEIDIPVSIVEVSIENKPNPPMLISRSLDSEGGEFDNVFMDTSNHFPERSFSSESLNSETSVDSNDSKSSLKIIESKFAKNGTLERQSNNNNNNSGQNEQSASSPCGLQVLVLWNNQITRNSSPMFSTLIESTTTLEILNVGKNLLCNEFLANIKNSLKTNTSLTNVGFQGAHLSDNGAKTLAEVLEFGGNSTLQRIDMRENNIQSMGLSCLNEALKSNKTVTRIDMEDIPRRSLDISLDMSSEYVRLLNSIRAQCARNENPPEQLEPISSSMKRVRAAYLNSRKISLTCQSIRTSPSGVINDKHLLDPVAVSAKKTGGRLRSPLPSPIPSPIASPVPSPSRNRFQVSRVAEGNHNNNTSTSPSPSSTGSSPTLFFPSNSRFRVVTVAEPTTPKTPPPPQPSPLQKPIQPTIPKTLFSVSTSNNPKHSTHSATAAATALTPSTTTLNDSVISVASIDSPDLEVKRFMTTMDDSCCSSISSSIDSIDNNHFNNTSISSTDDSFDLIVTSSSSAKNRDTDTNTTLTQQNNNNYSNNLLKIKNNSLSSLDISNSSQESLYGVHDISSSTSSSLSCALAPKVTSSLSNESTLTSIQNLDREKGRCELKPSEKQRVRKTSWIPPIYSHSKPEGTGGSGYSPAIDKLLSLFQHPSSLFTKSSPPNADVSAGAKEAIPVRKESPMGGLFYWSSGSKKDDEQKILKSNASPENTTPNHQPNVCHVDDIPKQLKSEMKENISPENTITSKLISNPIPSTKVIFKVGDNDDDESEDDIDTLTNKYCNLDYKSQSIMGTSSSGISSSSGGSDSSPNIISHTVGLGQIARDSLSMLKHPSTTSQDSMSMRSLDSLPEIIENQHQPQQQQQQQQEQQKQI